METYSDQRSPTGYPSRPLDPDKREIRILRLQPGRHDHPISCTLETASLDQYTWRSYPLRDYRLRHVPDLTFGRSVFPASQEDYLEAVKQHDIPPRTCLSHCRSARGRAYATSRLSDPVTMQIPSCGAIPCQCFEAISYTWGPSSEDRSITLCGRPGFKVTDNLYRALRRLRYLHRSTVLWVDAICINQSDLDERAQQVRMMADIFRTCWKLLIWLGDTTDRFDKTTFAVAARQPFGFSLSNEQYHVCLSAIHDVQKTTATLWWQRIWTLSEAVAFGLDPEPTVAAGSIRMPWWALIETFRLQSLAHELSDLASICQTGTERLSMLDFLILTRSRECENAKDRVYSLLGIVKNDEAKSLRPDYSRHYTPEMAYADATVAVMRGSGDLDALTYVDHTQLRDPQLPSWAVDFGNRSLEKYLSFRGSVDAGPYCESWTRATASASRRPVSIPGELHVRGLVFDRVRVRTPLPVPNQDTDFGIEDDKDLPLDLTRSLMYTIRRISTHDPYCSLARANSKGSSRQSHCIETCRGTYHPAKTFNWGQPLTNIWRPGQYHVYYNIHTWYRLLDLDTPRYNTYYASIRKQAFFVTEAGFIGMASEGIQAGDIVTLLYGSREAAILRQDAPGTHYTFHGLATVCGTFNGELLHKVPDLELEERDFVIR